MEAKYKRPREIKNERQYEALRGTRDTARKEVCRRMVPTPPGWASGKKGGKASSLDEDWTQG